MFKLKSAYKYKFAKTDQSDTISEIRYSKV